MKINKSFFGTTKQGEDVDLFTLENNIGTIVKIINYGATITAILTHDKQGVLGDIALGFDNIEGYESTENPYFGSTCGRYANRIKAASFQINGEKFHLNKNDGNNTLHGGLKGFDKHIWDSAIKDNKLLLSRTSPDMEEGYPGKLKINIFYSLNEMNDLTIEYTAKTNKPTFVNLTNHTYFNLKGSGDILNHKIQIHSDCYTVVDNEAIPTGEIRPVQNTEMDLRTPIKIGQNIKNVQGLGYDHNYCLNQISNKTNTAVEVIDPESGRILSCITNQPGVQFYSGNFLNGIKGKQDANYQKHAGFCLETQHYPDSPNHPHFPSTELNPKKLYKHICTYRFSQVNK